MHNIYEQPISSSMRDIKHNICNCKQMGRHPILLPTHQVCYLKRLFYDAGGKRCLNRRKMWRENMGLQVCDTSTKWLITSKNTLLFYTKLARNHLHPMQIPSTLKSRAQFWLLDLHPKPDFWSLNTLISWSLCWYWHAVMAPGADFRPLSYCY